jgi:hypothetical protein
VPKYGKAYLKAFHKFGAAVAIDDRVVDVVVTVRVTRDGKLQYDLSTDDGRGLGGNPEARQSDAQLRGPAVEGAPADLNVSVLERADKSPAGWGEVEADPPTSEDDIRGIMRNVNATRARVGLKGNVNTVVVRSDPDDT